MAKAGRKKVLRVGVFGGRRGAYLGSVFQKRDDARVVAACESSPGMKAFTTRQLGDVPIYDDFDRFLKHGMDAVVIANYAHEHVPYAVRAMEAGKHVLSECLACSTMAEGVALARAVERTGMVYTYAENYCFMAAFQEMRRLFAAGTVGEFTYAEGEYVHDCESIWPEIAYGRPDHWRNWMSATFYCSHAMGPVIKITGTRPVRVVGFTSPNRIGRRYGRRSDDMGLIVCQMSNGAIMKALQGMPKREPSSVWYLIYGTKGSMENNRWPDQGYLNVYVEGDKGTPFQRSYKPALPAAGSAGTGHGGADFYSIDGFVNCILHGRPNTIDVYEAIDMTLPGILAFRSALEGSMPYEVPDFRKESVRKRYEKDNWSVDPKFAGAGQPTSSSAHGVVNVPRSVYARQRKLYQEWVKGLKQR